MKANVYKKTLPREMYLYFTGYDEAGSAPSFQKFARRLGITTEELERFRRYKKFDKAYLECCEIRRDYLIDRALSRRFDPTFVRFLITEDSEGRDGTVEIKLEVVE